VAIDPSAFRQKSYRAAKRCIIIIIMIIIPRRHSGTGKVKSGAEASG